MFHYLKKRNFERVKNRPTCPNLIWPQSQTSAQNR
eukprot:SAG11_NODE_3487_length_2417_cov_1.462899_3_plen_34_part_01